MTHEEMNDVRGLIWGGAKLSIGRDYAGRQRIRLTSGPFGIFTRRYSVNEVEVAELKAMLQTKTKDAA